MSAAAPEREPISGPSGAPAGPINLAAAEQDWTQLQSWWAGLPTSRRRQLLTLDPTQALPLTVAADLHRQGIHCPLVLISDGTRMVRRAVPSPVLLDFLTAQAG